jgi:hypothetical protein
MGNDFGYAKADQTRDTGPKIEATPPACGCDGIPPRKPAHDDDLPILLFACGISFLVGFKIAKWSSKRHLERMKEIWRK